VNLGCYNGKFYEQPNNNQTNPYPFFLHFLPKQNHHNLNSKSLNSIAHQIIQSSQLRIIMSNLPTSALNDLQSFLIILVPSAIMLRL